MNPFIRFALKIISLPIFDMTRDYTIVRKLQEWAAKREEIPPDFLLLDEEILSSDGLHSIPVRIFAEPTDHRNGTLLFFHGGGYVIGNVDTYTPVCLQMVDETERPVMSVDYRLAPEHPFPQGPDDCYEVMRFLCEDTTGRFRPLTVIGDSAGANLATVSCLRLRDAGLPLPDAQVLIYPAVGWDYSEQSPFASVHEKAEDFGLTRKKLVEYYDLYVPDDVDPKDPRIAPLLADDHSGLPRTLIFTAEHDPLRDEGEAYGKKLQEAGVETEVIRVLDVPHGFWTYERPFNEAVETVYRELKAFLLRT